MESPIRSVIEATGSYIPTRIITNEHFLENRFHDESGSVIERSNEDIIAKFEAITGIRERRYVTEDLQTSDIALEASRQALHTGGIEADTIDMVVVAHNFGDIAAGSRGFSDLVPSLASRVKAKLGIGNPDCVAYDLPFGCPGWLQAVIQADVAIRSRMARRALIIGAEVLSRVIDPHDRDSMIYADGAGACIVGARETTEPIGILTHHARSDTGYTESLCMGPSYSPDGDNDRLYLKMKGRKVYEYAVRIVPDVIARVLNAADMAIRDVAKVLVHQANAKLDEAILKRVYKLFDLTSIPAGVMPMTISWLGNSSVATLPTMFDLLTRDKLDGHRVASGDAIVFASVGAGMNANAMVYRVP
jgi:3-oxoacyl-[acyl-carrier-protein] synthase-3